jgi:hypothetical protein
MRNLVILAFLIASISGVVKGAEPSDIEGVYLGSRCGVRATIMGNQMKFEIVKDSMIVAEDSIPIFKFEQLETDDTFLFEREVFGRTGEETKTISGSTLGSRLRNLTIKTKGSGFFNSRSKSCKSLIPQGRL